LPISPHLGLADRQRERRSRGSPRSRAVPGQAGARRRSAVSPHRGGRRRHARPRPQRADPDLDQLSGRQGQAAARDLAGHLSVGASPRRPRSAGDRDRAGRDPRPGRSAVTASKRLSRAMGKTIADYQLIADGDHVMVAVSGGKDSYTLLDLLRRAQRKAPISFRITAVHLDQVQPGYDGAPLRRWLEDFGAPFEIVREDTYSTVVELTAAGKAYCAVCSRLRRGVLYNVAERLGCNKIALGHHRDDALETLLMNLFYAGKLQAMPAKYTTDDGRFEVIRPLIECAESDIVEHATFAGYPILPCNLCGSQDNLRREKMRELI